MLIRLNTGFQKWRLCWSFPWPVNLFPSYLLILTTPHSRVVEQLHLPAKRWQSSCWTHLNLPQSQTVAKKFFCIIWAQKTVLVSVRESLQVHGNVTKNSGHCGRTSACLNKRTLIWMCLACPHTLWSDEIVTKIKSQRVATINLEELQILLASVPLE
jgi:hypothetical protein